MLKAVLKIADQRGKDHYLDTAPMTVMLYKRWGFRLMARVEVLEGYVVRGMLRRAPGRA